MDARSMKPPGSGRGQAVGFSNSPQSAHQPKVGEGLAPSRAGGKPPPSPPSPSGETSASNPPRRQRIRLDEPIYRDAGLVFSVTVGSSPRSPIFQDLDWAFERIDILRALRLERGNPVYAYCLMPDHVHLLVETLASSPLPDFVGPWKSLCYQARRRRGIAAVFWQKRFFDRALRGTDDLRATALYILNNPVRKALVNDFHDYPLCGSLEWEL